MLTTVSMLPMSKPEPGLDLLFFSPDERRAQRVALRLRDLATVHWENSRHFSSERWTQQRNGPHPILLDYAPDNADASTELARQLVVLAPGTPLLGVGSTGTDRAAGVLAALRAGVIDFIDMDAADNEIRVLLDHVSRRPQPVGSPATAPRKRGQLVLLLGARPGMGTSTLAAHLGALAMPPAAKHVALGTPAQALLLDLGNPGGDAALYLGVSGEFHYTDALRHAGRIDSTLVRTALPHHASRLAVLSQPAGTTEPPAPVVEAEILVDRLLGVFDLLLCDLGGLPGWQIPDHLLRAADDIWLVADQSIGSMVSLDSCLRGLEQSQARDRRLSLVINRHDDSCGIRAHQIAERFALPLLATLPERARALRTSANQGLLLHQVAPRDPYIRALGPLLAKLRISTPPTVALSGWKDRLLHARGFR